MYRIPALLFLLISSIYIFPQTERTLQDTLQTEVSDSSSIKTDSTITKDSLTNNNIISDSLKTLSQRIDSIIIFTGKPFFYGSTILSHNDLVKTDYRYTGDFFKLAGMSFNKDLGFIGQNNELLIYGAGFKEISYFEDGVLMNNRSLNQLDLNDVPSELLDSIEILPAVRGFLYGSLNNPVAVNFITKDRVPGLAYSRIKYYEGPFGEAMIDAILSTNIFRKLVLYFEASNKKVDRRYFNSSSSSWLGRIKLKYFLNEYLNLQASYNYVKSTKGLNGGVDLDSIMNITTNVNSYLYNEVLAPVNFSDRSYDVKQHHLGLRALSEINKFSKTDLSLYYKFSLDELNNTGNAELLDQDLKYKTYGASIRQIFSKEIFDVEINGVYEFSDFLTRQYFQVDTLPVSLIDFKSNLRNYSLSGIFSVHTTDNRLKLSAFYKFTGIEYDFYAEVNNLNGFGFDIVFSPSEGLNIYAGYSLFEPQLNADNISTYEAAINYRNEIVSSGIRVFLRKAEIKTDPIIFRTYNSILDPFKDLLGVQLNLKAKLWKLLFEGQGCLYSEAGDEPELFCIPKQHFNAGIYFTDTLFNSNLDLKTGFVYYFTGEQNLFNYTVPNSSRVDFTLAGEIQKTAIAYFTWENLLGAEYFIVPYYPMPLRGIRFGVSWEFLN